MQQPTPTAKNYRDAAREIRLLLAANEILGYLSRNGEWVLRSLEHVQDS